MNSFKLSFVQRSTATLRCDDIQGDNQRRVCVCALIYISVGSSDKKMSLKGSDGSIWRLLAHLSKPVFKYCFLNLGSHTELSHSTNRPMVCRINWSVCLVRCVRMRTRENRKRRRGCSLCFFLDSLCPRARF